MPKIQPINPSILSEGHYPEPQSIPCYVYQKTLVDEMRAGQISVEQVREIYFQMVLARKFDEMLLENKATNFYRQVEYQYDGPLHVSIGQEAVAVGQAFSLDEHDLIFGTHRNHAEVIAKGLTAIGKLSDEALEKIMTDHQGGRVDQMLREHRQFGSTKERARVFFLYSVLAEIFTKATGLNLGMGGSMHMFFTPFGIYPNNAVVGASPSIAIGAALYKLINQRPGVVIANIGDGAITCGPVWEAINFVAMDQYRELWDAPYDRRPPFMLNVINNQYAMGGQPVGETMGSKGVARVGMGINPEQMWAERVNGQNVLAVIDAQRRQSERALAGQGPTLTEFMTYRYEGHSSADAAEPYRLGEEVKAWREHDPILLFEKEILAAKALDQAALKQITAQAEELVFEVYQLNVDPVKSPFIDWENDHRVLDEMMLDPRETFESPRHKEVELSQPLSQNARYIQLSKKARYAFEQNGREVSALRQYQIRDAIFEALAQEVTEQPGLIVYGQEHRDWGGAYAVWRGLTELLPYHRFFNTMIGEAAIVGSAVGYALCGGRAVVEIMYFDFLFRAGDEIANQMAKWRAMSGGMLNVPLVLRVLIGATYGAQHSQDYTSVIAHIPGLKLVQPATPYDAKGLMVSALREPNPVVFVETQNLYGMGERFVETGVPQASYAVKIGQGVVRRTGQDLTIVTLGSALYPALEAAEQLAKRWKISAEVIDARSAVPFDYDIVLKSLKKTGQIVLVNNGAERNNFMRHVASTLSELAFNELDAPPVVLGARNWIMPGAGLDRWIYPQAENILAAIHAKITPLADFRPQRHETSVELARRNKQGV